VSAHAGCLAAAAGGPCDVTLPVPSSARPAGSPLAGVDGLESACAGLGQWSPHLLARAEAPVGHMRPDAGAFEVPAGLAVTVAGRRAVLLDDTYVSGARAQSAAAALRRAGARSVVIVVLGRVLRPDRSAAHAAFLARQRVVAAAGEKPCCRCVQAGASTE
jgi:glutamine phosphoribosylpyrophosphate amidotransferase